MLSFLLVHGVFWALLLIGATDIGRRGCAIYVALWVLGFVGSGWIPSGGFLFLSYIAVLDIALVLHVFQGDVHLR